MNDLTDRLAGLGTTAGAPTDATVAADVARGSTALARRRRTRAAGAGVGLTLALGVGLGVAVIAQPDDPAAPPSAVPDTSEAPAPDVALVAYEGEQPEGFEVAVIPEGFFVQGSHAFSFTIAPDGDTSHPDGYEHKLVVMLESQSKAPGDLEGDPVQVGDAAGGIRTSAEATTLEFMQGDFDVVVQMWNDVGLTDEQLIEFAEGITVTDDAQAGVG
jgi:hypothetical protein